jgi:L-rhamnose mutarotase
MRRYGQVIGLDEQRKEEYRAYHASCWPAVIRMITACHIRNYSIFMKDSLLFSYFEYHGTDFEKDMAVMAADEMTRKWWELVGKAQVPLESREEGEWWASMEEVFHLD